MGLFLQLTLYAPVSLRGTSQALAIVFAHLFGPRFAIANANTGRLWLLRLGLYELTRPKEKADDWVWIVDHTIQISSLKCLLIVGCRLEVWQQQEEFPDTPEFPDRISRHPTFSERISRRISRHPTFLASFFAHEKSSSGLHPR